MSWKKVRNVRGKQTVMTANDELNSGSENGGRLVENLMNIDQRDKLVTMLECVE